MIGTCNSRSRPPQGRFLLHIRHPSGRTRLPPSPALRRLGGVTRWEPRTPGKRNRPPPLPPRGERAHGPPRGVLDTPNPTAELRKSDARRRQPPREGRPKLPGPGPGPLTVSSTEGSDIVRLALELADFFGSSPGSAFAIVADGVISPPFDAPS